jgi:hypothetical protein
MVTRFFPREKFNFDVPGSMGREYVSELRGKGFVKVSKLV